MFHLLLAGALALASILLVPAAALAADTVVTVPWGGWAASLLQTVAAVALPIILWGLRMLPTQIQALIRTAQVDQLLLKAISYGINSVEGAAKDKALTVDVGNAVLAEALNYAIRNGPGWVDGWLGGPEGIRQRIIARLNLEPKAAIQ